MTLPQAIEVAEKIKELWTSREMFINGHNPVGKEIEPSLSILIDTCKRIDREKLRTTIFNWADKQMNSDVYMENNDESLAITIYNMLTGEER